MSTRSQVIFLDDDGTTIYPVTVYRHSDGYPYGKHGVLHTLMPVVRDFLKYRGKDVSYLVPQVSHAFVDLIHKGNDRWMEEMKESNQEIGSFVHQCRFTGVGVEPFDIESGFHGDVAYVYFIKHDCVEVRNKQELFLAKPNFKGPGLLASFDIKSWEGLSAELLEKTDHE